MLLAVANCGCKKLVSSCLSPLKWLTLFLKKLTFLSKNLFFHSKVVSLQINLKIMSYNIETRSISEFVTDSKIKLPRFQRKSTWTAKQNFELAISIFQEYPVGVVIINDEGHTSWLLDGRQRRSALRDLRANPDLVYDWARKYIKFKSNQDVVELKHMFWDRIDAYLQQEEDDDHNTSGGSSTM